MAAVAWLSRCAPLRAAARAAAAAEAAAAAALRARTATHPHTIHSYNHAESALIHIRAQLPAHTLAALRLVSRAARDDFVDAHCKALRELRLGADAAQLAACAPRLRRLERLELQFVGGGASHGHSELAAALARLPAGGAALAEVDLGAFSCLRESGSLNFLPGTAAGGARCDAAGPDKLAAAIGRLAGLRVLRARVSVMEAAFKEAFARALGALGAGIGGAAPAARLALALEAYSPTPHGGLAELVPLGRLESLWLGQQALDALLPELSAPGVAAAALTALRSLDVDGGFLRVRPQPFLELGRAPWLAQLTQLRLSGPPDAVGTFAHALAPGALTGLRELSLACPTSRLPARDAGAVLAACEPASLEALSLGGAPLAAAARLAEGLPTLNSLGLFGSPQHRRTFEDGAPALKAASLAPLTRFDFTMGEWLAERPERLESLLSARWAASLRHVFINGDFWGGGGGRALRALAALSQLRRLDTLSICADVSGEDLRRAAADGSAAAWAPRLAAFELFGDSMAFSALDELLQLPFKRLERLAVGLAADPTKLQRLMDECVRALPTLKRVAL